MWQILRSTINKTNDKVYANIGKVTSEIVPNSDKHLNHLHGNILNINHINNLIFENHFLQLSK